MAKPCKRKKNKVPKITEAEYTAYLATLKNKESVSANAPLPRTLKSEK